MGRVAGLVVAALEIRSERVLGRVVLSAGNDQHIAVTARNSTTRMSAVPNMTD
jgi:hypothetical protein